MIRESACSNAQAQARGARQKPVSRSELQHTLKLENMHGPGSPAAISLGTAATMRYDMLTRGASLPSTSATADSGTRSTKAVFRARQSKLFT
jgi:hypothetical protein